MTNPLAVHEFMEFNHKRQYKPMRDLVKHRVISFNFQECYNPASLKTVADRIIEFYAGKGYIAAYAIHCDKMNPHIHVVVDNMSYNDLTMLHMGTLHELYEINIIVSNWFFYHNGIYRRINKIQEKKYNGQV